MQDDDAPTPTSNWALMKKFVVYAKDGSQDVYLKRLRILQTPWFGIYLHDILQPDRDPDPHDHPWNFRTFILRGGYTEEVVCTRAMSTREIAQTKFSRRWFSWTTHRMTRIYAHRITSVQPRTKTLVITGRRDGEWYFWTPEGPVLWSHYIKPGDTSAYPSRP